MSNLYIRAYVVPRETGQNKKSRSLELGLVAPQQLLFKWREDEWKPSGSCQPKNMLVTI
jgi:hypothetical protein